MIHLNPIYTTFFFIKHPRWHLIFTFLPDEETPSNVSTDRHTCKRKKTKHPGNSWFDKYNVVVSLIIVAAVLFGLYLVLILYSKKEFAKQSLQTKSIIYENA